MPAQCLRVLLVAQPTTGGTGRCVEQLAVAGVEHGFEVRVACPADGPLAGRVAEAGATWSELSLHRSPSLGDVSHVGAVRRLAADADVVHLHSSKAGAVGRLAMQTMRHRPACAFTPHGWSWQSGGPLAPAYRLFERAMARTADAVVAVSEEEREAGRAVLGDSVTIDVIENGIDTTHFTPHGSHASRDGASLIVCVGRLAHPKGQDVAIRALAAMHSQQARLRLVGDGPDRPALQALAHALGVADRVELIGEVADAAAHLRSADVVVVPSHSEGHSLAMLEAMACGRVVVTTSVAGSRSVGDAGVIVPIGEPTAMAHALDALVSDDAHRAQLGRRARHRAEKLFDLRRMTARNIELWHRIATSRGIIPPC